MPEAITEAQQRAAHAAGAAIRELIPAVRAADLSGRPIAARMLRSVATAPLAS